MEVLALFGVFIFVMLLFFVITGINLAKAFGKDTGFTILLLFLPMIGFPILAFGKSVYVYNRNTPIKDVIFNQSVNQQTVNNEQVQPMNEPVNNEENMKLCPQCNNKVSNDSEYCFICGYKF